MILNMGFKDAYAFRPGAILPERGIKSRTGWNNAFYMVFRPFFSAFEKNEIGDHDHQIKKGHD